MESSTLTPHNNMPFAEIHNETIFARSLTKLCYEYEMKREIRFPALLCKVDSRIQSTYRRFMTVDDKDSGQVSLMGEIFVGKEVCMIQGLISDGYKHFEYSYISTIQRVQLNKGPDNS